MTDLPEITRNSSFFKITMESIRHADLSKQQPPGRRLHCGVALLADGKLCVEEILVLDYTQAHEQLGLSAHQLDAVTRAPCEDLCVGPHSGGGEAGLIDSRTIAGLMAEIDDTAVQR